MINWTTENFEKLFKDWNFKNKQINRWIKWLWSIKLIWKLEFWELELNLENGILKIYQEISVFRKVNYANWKQMG